LAIVGCVGVLEDLYEQRYLSDLRGAYEKLLQQKIRIDLQTLRHSLAKFNLPLL
jgi:predicted nucleic acid-binding protein